MLGVGAAINFALRMKSVIEDGRSWWLRRLDVVVTEEVLEEMMWEFNGRTIYPLYTTI
jgi:hypothetical protein